jgi:hypothetical protein
MCTVNSGNKPSQWRRFKTAQLPTPLFSKQFLPISRLRTAVQANAVDFTFDLQNIVLTTGNKALCYGAAARG